MWCNILQHLMIIIITYISLANVRTSLLCRGANLSVREKVGRTEKRLTTAELDPVNIRDLLAAIESDCVRSDVHWYCNYNNMPGKAINSQRL